MAKHIQEGSAAGGDLTGTFPNATLADTTNVQSIIATHSVSQAQLDAKQNTLVSGTNIKTVNGTSVLGTGNITVTSTVADATTTTKGIIQLAGDLGGTAAAPTVTKTYTKSDVGLANVDNTSDANKPVSTAQAAADALKVSKSGDTMTGPLVLPATGLKVLDAGNNNTMTITTGTRDFTADRTFNLFMRDADTTLTINANTTLTGGTHSGTNTGDQTTITGNAGTATALQTARTIAGVSFDGTANISLASTNLSDSASIILTTGAQTLSSKRITKRVITATSTATPTPNADTTDVYFLSTLTVAATFAAPTGTPTDGQQLTIRIKSVAAQTLAWNAIYIPSGSTTLPTTSVAGKTITCGFTYDAAMTKWVLLAVDATGY